jgi:hypothetical protein
MNTVEILITDSSIDQVAAAIQGTGPKVDRSIYRAHVPKFVSKSGDILRKYPTDTILAQRAKELVDYLRTSDGKVDVQELIDFFEEADAKPIMLAVWSPLDEPD